MTSQERRLIRTLPLFAGIAESHVSKLLSGAALQRVPSQVVLIRQGDRPDFLYVVAEGSVELLSTWGDQETIVTIAQAKAIIILSAVIRNEACLMSARTQAPAQILALPAAVVRDVFGRDSIFARAVATELAAQYRIAIRALKDQKLRTSAERLANWILRTDSKCGRTGRLEIPYEKRTLASRLGMTPENLSRNLAKLKRHGVSTQGREIVIDDRDRLEPFAKPDPLIDG